MYRGGNEASPPTRPGMETNDRVAEKLPVEMGVYFRGQNGFMTQHFLYGPQIGSPFNEMGGKGMPECMGTDIFADTSRCCQILDYAEHHHP